MNQPTLLPLRPNVCILIMNRDGLLFIGERLNEPGSWQLPQGGVDRNFSLEENALREAQEETGIPREMLRVVAQFKATHQYEFERPPEAYKDKWRGQSQTFWLLEFQGEDSIIDLTTHEPEFRSWCWVSSQELLKKVEPRRVPGYLKPITEFEEYLRSLKQTP